MNGIPTKLKIFLSPITHLVILGLKNYITSRILSIILIALSAASLFIYLNFF